MADPVSGGIGKASQQMMQELQKQMQQEVQNQAQTSQTQGVQFDNLVAQQPPGVNDATKVAKTQKVNEAQRTTETSKATDVLKAAVEKGGNVDPSSKLQPVDASPSGKGLKKLLSQVVEGQNKLDDIIKMATSGKQYGQQDLLAIQASVYKFSQELDLTSKVVEKATSGVKQTMSTQV